MKFIGLLFLLTFTSLMLHAQRPDFKLRNGAPMRWNPANTGTYDQIRINQAISFPTSSAFASEYGNYISYDQHFDKLRGGLGIEYLSIISANGIKNSNRFSLNYAWQQNLGNKLTLSLGAGITLNHERTNYSKFTFGDCLIHGNEPAYKDGIRRENLLEYKGGIMIYGEHFFAGGQYAKNTWSGYCPYPINQTDYFSVYGGYAITPFKNKNLSFIPSIHYSYEDKFQLLSFQAMFNTGRFSVGANYSARDHISLMAGVYIWNFQFKFSYVIVDNPLTNYARPNSEFAIQFHFPKSRKRKSRAFTLNLF